jgi:hypothetical protein
MTDELILTPNVEAIVVQFLRDQPELSDIVGERIYTTLPTACEFPAIRVTLFYERSVTDIPHWVTAHDIQVDSFGGPKTTAWEAAETARACLSQRFIGEHGYTVGARTVSGTVTDVRCWGLRDLPDTEWEPAKPRFMFTATITVHPSTGNASV